MNRRELLKSAAVAVCAPVSVLATNQIAQSVVAGENAGSPMIIHHWNKPLIVVHTQRRMNATQLAQVRQDLDNEGDRHGCMIVFVPDCEGVMMAGANAAKYGFTEKTPNHSLSVFCQTAEELREWMPKFNERVA